MGKPHYRAVVVSPHLDDAVFSCGGMMAQLADDGPVLVLNVFTQYLSALKIHGAVLGEERHQEEVDAADFLKFESRSLGELDAPFRRDAYRQLGNLFRPPVAEDLQWLPTLREKMFAVLAELDFDQIYVPLGVGWHVDHVLTHLVFEPWAARAKLLYYEDAPYCCIPHATRYRLNEIATYPREAHDQSLAPANETGAWWQTSRSYANTALMKNLKPWIVRQFAAPTVSFYLYRLMGLYRNRAQAAISKCSLQPRLIPIAAQLGRKVEAMTLYKSQFNEFFSSPQDCTETFEAYAVRMRGRSGPVERYWALP